MTRQEAIQKIKDAFDVIKSDRCCSGAERDATDEDCIAVLHALGVLDEEIPND